MATKKVRVVAYLDPGEYRRLKIHLVTQGLNFSRWVRMNAKQELVREALKQKVL